MMYRCQTLLLLLICAFLPPFSSLSMATGLSQQPYVLTIASMSYKDPIAPFETLEQTVSNMTNIPTEKASEDSTTGKEGVSLETLVPDGIEEEKAEFIRWLLPQIEQAREEIGHLMSIDIPNSLIVAQAALESGWGTSHGAKNRRNLFGLMRGNGQGMKFSSSLEGLKKYMLVLDQHPAYRTLRAKLERTTNSLELTKHLGSYSESPSYSNELNKIIRKNKLAELDR